MQATSRDSWELPSQKRRAVRSWHWRHTALRTSTVSLPFFVKATGMGWVPPASTWALPGPWQFSQPMRSFSVRGCFRKSRPILVWLNRLNAGSWQALHSSAPT